MNVTKMLKKLKANHLAMGLAVLAIAYVLYNYSSSKSSVISGMANANLAPQSSSASCGNNFKPSAPLGHNAEPASAQGSHTSGQNLLPASCSSQQAVDPKDLLPKDNNSDFAQMNPLGSGDLMNANLLKAGHHIGINTVGQSLRNANLQLRSEPANPQMKVGPWNNTTIGPDSRRPMEIGCNM